MSARCFLLGVIFQGLCFFAAGQPAVLQDLVAQRDGKQKVERLLGFAGQASHQDAPLAEQALETALSVSRRQGYHHEAGVVLLNLASLKNRLSRRPEALCHAHEALLHFRRDTNYHQMAKSCLVLSELQVQDGRLDSAMHYNLEAIAYLEHTPFRKNLFYAYYGVAGLLEMMDFTDRSLQYYDKALQLAREEKDTALLVEALTVISKATLHRGQYARAMPAANEALALVEGQEDDYLRAVAFGNKAHLLVALRQADSALYYSKEAYRYSPLPAGTYTRVTALLSLADAYRLKGNSEQSYACLWEALPLAEQTAQVLFLKDIHERLSAVQFQRGYYKEAYQHERQFRVLQDSLLNEKTSRISAELEARYQAAQKEKTIVEKQLQMARDRLWLYGSVAALVVSLLAGGFVYVQARSRQKDHARELKDLCREKELHLLQALIQGEEKERSRIARDLHDGVSGMLAAARMHFHSLGLKAPALTGEEGFRQANHLLGEAILEVRKTSHNLMPEVLTQYGLDEALRRYCRNITNDRMITVQYDSWGQVGRFVDSFELSVYRIVQELLNNIVRHSRASEALVQVSRVDDLLSITVEDNGVGMQGAGDQAGMGLQSLHSRVKAMNGRLEVQTASDSGVSAYLEFDVSELEKELPDENN